MTAPVWVRLSSVLTARAIPKSVTLTLPVVGDEHVAGLHVAVDHAVAMGVGQGAGDVGGDLGGPVRVQRPGRAQDRRQRPGRRRTP